VVRGVLSKRGNRGPKPLRLFKRRHFAFDPRQPTTILYFARDDDDEPIGAIALAADTMVCV
jgi:hypothetical protein